MISIIVELDSKVIKSGEIFLQTCAKSKSGKVTSHRHDCNYLKLRAKRAKIFGLLTGALKVYMLKRGWRGAPKIYMLKRVGGGTQIKRNCVDQQNRIKFKQRYFRLCLGAPLGRVPAGSPTQSPMELRH